MKSLHDEANEEEKFEGSQRLVIFLVIATSQQNSVLASFCLLK